MPVVSGITVNVGTGYDNFDIHSASGLPALNIGLGGVLFKGSGTDGDDLVVQNDSTSSMTILGGVYRPQQQQCDRERAHP